MGQLDVAPLFRTQPQPPDSQPEFWNTAAVGRSRLTPEQILAIAKLLELRAGRRRGRRFGPRPLDIDLLLYGERVSSAPELTLPHPRLRHRRFVLAPLASIAPDLRLPPDGAAVGALLLAVGQVDQVEEVGWGGESP